MDRTLLDSILVATVAGSCLVEYYGTRLVGRLTSPTRRRVAVVALAAWTPALAAFPASVVLTDVLVLALSLAAGMALSRQIGSAGALSTMLAVAAIVDLISIRAGPSRWLIEQLQHGHAGTLIQFLAVSLRLHGRLVPVIGISDLMFFTAIVAVGRRLAWPEAAVLGVPLAGLLSALAVGLWSDFTPALPFLAVAVFLYSRALPPARHFDHGGTTPTIRA
jgi:hypothetical protein